MPFQNPASPLQCHADSAVSSIMVGAGIFEHVNKYSSNLLRSDGNHAFLKVTWKDLRPEFLEMLCKTNPKKWKLSESRNT